MSDIAVVGIGCHYAGGIESPETFWDLVVDKRDGVREIPPERWDWRRFYDPDKHTPARMYVKRAAFMTSDPWAFDPDFFGISPREASSMDAQQRLVLQTAWEAFDDAGIAGRISGSSLGVYMGVFTMDQAGIVANPQAVPYADMHTAASTSYTMVSNRLAYALNLVGPAITVDTACSSSLVAFHLACRGITDGDCELAVAGGVSVMAEPEPFVFMCKGGFLAADGRSKAFDASADGYGRGEGVGMVVLKKLAAAQRDGDRIYAVVKATGSNQDGRTTAITVPNADLQEELAEEVARRAGIAPDEVTYVEAHGTGTPVGDPLELKAIGHAYGAVEGRTTPLGVGSVKTQLGHTEAASGIASVIKSALAISHRTIAPQYWFDTPNPDIAFEEWNLRLQLEAEKVGPEVDRFTIAVNGFGYGGTNAHVILQEYRPPHHQGGNGQVRKPRHYGVLPLSARSERAVRELASGFAEHIAEGADPGWLAEAAWTRRNHHPLRAGVAFTDDATLSQGLLELAEGAGRVSRVVAGKVAEPVFVFTGMGPQWWAMARGLLEADGVFAAEAARIDTEFQQIAGWSIIAELLCPQEQSRATGTVVAQAGNFLVQAALCAELAQLGIRPAVVVGHSVGEVAAAYISGALSLQDALLVGHHRARLQAATAGSGGMLAIGLPLDKAQQLIAGDARVDIAAINSPSAVTLAGDITRLDEIAESLTEDGVFAKRLQVEVPYHSHLMDPVLDELRTVLADLRPSAPRIPLYSTVTGTRLTEAEMDADYWCGNVRQPVRFADATRELIAAGSRVFLEIGPHPVLAANIREILRTAGETGTTIATLHRKQHDTDSIRQTIAGLYAAGVLDIEGLFTDLPSPTPHLDLPVYPWQKTHLRNELPHDRIRRHGPSDGYVMLGDQNPDDTTRWQLPVGTGVLPWLADHVVNGARILPGTSYLDMALSAVLMRTESTQAGLADVRFVAPLFINDGALPLMRLDLEESTRRFTIRSRGAVGSVWTIHATGRLVEGAFDQTKSEVPPTDTMAEVDPAGFYAMMAASGLEYGPEFQRITSLRVSDTVVVATVDATVTHPARYAAYPAVVDAAFQAVATLLAGTAHRDGALVPVEVRGVRLLAALPKEVTVVARLRSSEERSGSSSDPVADIALLDAEHNTCMRVIGVKFGAIAPRPSPMQRMIDFFYEEVWEKRDPIDPETLPATGDLSTLIVVLGTAPNPAAQQILRVSTPGSAGAELFVVGDPGRADLEVALAERLRAVYTREGVERLHLVVVAGTGYDEVDDLWVLRRVAVTAEGFLDTWLAEHDIEKPFIGDDSFYVSLVTENAFTHPDGDVAPDPGQAALAGAQRVLLNEQSRLRWRLLDLDGHVADVALARELAVPGAFGGDRADDVFLHGGARWRTTVSRTLQDRLDALDEPVPLTDPEANFRLELPKSKVFSQLDWRRCDRRSPGPGEVEVRMTAIGLNYKDSMKVMGVLGERELAPTYYGLDLGMEGAGEIVRVGADVTEFEVGDRVSLRCKDMIRRYNTLSVGRVFHLATDLEPGTVSSSTAFMSAVYALRDVARVRPGEMVLVHGAAGGVGSAAVQIAKLYGARVIGTASTEERRAYVLEQGADYAVNSRSLNFVDEVLARTDGQGADVVINSAPGEVLVQNFDAVAEFGRIVELGKADIYFGGVLELRHFDKNMSYFSIDLDRMLKRRSELMDELIAETNHRFAEHTYRPLPYETYGTADVGRAFEEVARSTRIGRVVLDMTEAAPLVRPRIPEVVIDAGARYLVTGGFGGFGLAVGRWLVDKGARHLTLLGRRGATTDAARAQLSAWEKQGVEVIVESVDVTDAEAVTAVIARAHTPEHPLRGVFHIAGVLDDKRIGAMSRDDLGKVFRPKLAGARALWRGVEVAGAQLDQFVLFSSGSTFFGNIGQFAYCAANLAVEAYAEILARQGVPVWAVGWGHMVGAGMLADDEILSRYLSNMGILPMDMEEGPQYLEQVLRLDVTRPVIFPIDWTRIAAGGSSVSLTGRVADMIEAAAQHDSAAARLQAELIALGEAKRKDVVAHMLAERLASVMGVSVESLDLTVPVPELGLDSLMAVEFGTLVTQALDVDLMTLKLGRSFTLEQAGEAVAESIVTGTGGTVPAPATPADSPAAVDAPIAVPENAQFPKKMRRALSRRR
ncbi:type I polyketide synthase [Nocardia sp. 004]|uniref:type I polyketide synthase n=1 Tax=Nocardia sp. 004 TaxID=3385978 RepID=UPI0039A075F3